MRGTTKKEPGNDARPSFSLLTALRKQMEGDAEPVFDHAVSFAKVNLLQRKDGLTALRQGVEETPGCLGVRRRNADLDGFAPIRGCGGFQRIRNKKIGFSDF